MKGPARRNSGIAGIGGGKGVEANVSRSLQWLKMRREELGGDIVVNLVGHSRGSITCYKIARALCNDQSTTLIPINIFAIDPVPGNTGHVFTGNGENYKNIILGGNVWRGNSFLLLAESEHRLVFRPYVDALYSVGLDNHKFDTIPGTHGGINMLDGAEHEAADIVLSRALGFLIENGSPMRDTVKTYILDGKEKLGKYAELMCRIKKYKRHASVNPLKGNIVNFAMSGFQVERHRIANVQGNKGGFGPKSAIQDDDKAQQVRRKDFHGLNLSEAIGLSGGEAHASLPHRFFCNLEHQNLFGVAYSTIYETVRTLERSGVGREKKDEIKRKLLGEWNAAYTHMQGAEKTYFDRFLEKRGIALNG
jgi:hypothetical protein